MFKSNLNFHPPRLIFLRFVTVASSVKGSSFLSKKKFEKKNRHRCYICLEGEDDGKLMRGCACRGASAGFAHVECLTKLAMSKEASGNWKAIYDAWNKCGNCKQHFTGALKLEMTRRFWRRYRSGQDLERRYDSTRAMAAFLDINGEFDATNQLLDEASTFVGNNKEILLDLKLFRAEMAESNGKKIEAVELLQAMLPEAKVFTANPQLYLKATMNMSTLLIDLDRHQEAHEAATEAATFTKANYGPETPTALIAMKTYALACEKVDRMEESKAILEDVLATEIRVRGRDHPQTLGTIQMMRSMGFGVPSG